MRSVNWIYYWKHEKFRLNIKKRIRAAAFAENLGRLRKCERRKERERTGGFIIRHLITYQHYHFISLDNPESRYIHFLINSEPTLKWLLKWIFFNYHGQLQKYWKASLDLGPRAYSPMFLALEFWNVEVYKLCFTSTSLQCCKNLTLIL